MWKQMLPNTGKKHVWVTMKFICCYKYFLLPKLCNCLPRNRSQSLLSLCIRSAIFVLESSFHPDHDVEQSHFLYHAATVNVEWTAFVNQVSSMSQRPTSHGGFENWYLAFIVWPGLAKMSDAHYAFARADAIKMRMSKESEGSFSFELVFRHVRENWTQILSRLWNHVYNGKLEKYKQC